MGSPRDELLELFRSLSADWRVEFNTLREQVTEVRLKLGEQEGRDKSLDIARLERDIEKLEALVTKQGEALQVIEAWKIRVMAMITAASTFGGGLTTALVKLLGGDL